ncbi:hypothetical protein TanjilG_15920 [Lupinus angustifolius]|uniref:Uncharacterized protein n=1 Tax=Lupinus angustifolius TaxID=3871 RepID=A0A4P1RHD0_LUPAN|nr:hypothetical protein TanjilG_15920 [Lupinus angustifolius]
MRKIVHILKTDIIVVSKKAKKDERDKLTIEIAIWNESDYLYKNFILNELSVDLYDYHNPYKSVKLIWYALEKERNMILRKLRQKIYDVSPYFKYQMTNNKSVESQSYRIAHEIISDGMFLES